VTDARNRRQRLIADLLRAEPIASQEEVTERLSAQGFAVTQATISRDLDQLGAVKVKSGGIFRYMLPEAIGDKAWAAGRLGRILADWVQSIEASGNLLVLRTPPGSAHVVAHAVDQARLDDVAGTIAGDDTLFVAVRAAVAADAVAERFRRLAEER